jgi:hypothetical protein
MHDDNISSSSAGIDTGYHQGSSIFALLITWLLVLYLTVWEIRWFSIGIILHRVTLSAVILMIYDVMSLNIVRARTTTISSIHTYLILNYSCRIS